MKFVDYIYAEGKEDFFNILRELRPHLDESAFRDLMNASEKEGYRMVGLYAEGRLCSVMGFRIMHDFSHGRHLYIDELVTTKEMRSKGYGRILLEYAEELAARNSCEMVRLCSSVHREDSHRFYEVKGYLPKSYAFKKNIQVG